jgi:hypothetical protein
MASDADSYSYIFAVPGNIRSPPARCCVRAAPTRRVHLLPEHAGPKAAERGHLIPEKRALHSPPAPHDRNP